MLNGVNIEQVKQYNASLKQYRDKAAQIRAGIDFNKNELNRLCQELSAELGIEVTPENVEQIRAKQIEEIESTLRTGNEILNRIKAEESGAVTPVNTAVNLTPVAAPTAPVAPVVPTATVAEAPNIPVPPATPVAETTPQDPFSSIGNIPSIFSQI